MNRPVRSIVAIALVLSAGLMGCATMMRGPMQVVSVESWPAGARVRVQPGAKTAETPALVTMWRKSEHMVVVEHEGYQPASIVLVPKRSLCFWRNLVWIHPVVFITGFIVDISTGSCFNLEPDRVSVTLVPVASARH